VTSARSHVDRLKTIASMVLASLVIGSVPAVAAPTATSRPSPAPAVDSAFQFGVNCRGSHWLMDDPIVHPGMAGTSHEHDFFGNTETDADSTPASLVNTQTTCDVKDDDSAYWVPTLRRNGHRIAPYQVRLYYQRHAGADGTIQTIPAGLVMISGNSKATSPQSTEIATWRCAGDSMTSLPTPPSCPTGTDLVLIIRFPDCWNGTDLDSWNHKAHMARRVSSECPASHPVLLPRIVMNVHFPGGSNANLSLASGSLYSAHADFMNGWKQATLATLVDTLNP